MLAHCFGQVVFSETINVMEGPKITYARQPVLYVRKQDNYFRHSIMSSIKKVMEGKYPSPDAIKNG